MNTEAGTLLMKNQIMLCQDVSINIQRQPYFLSQKYVDHIAAIVLERDYLDDVTEAMSDVAPGLAYIRQTPEINNVLLTGGDPLILSTKKLRMIIEQLREIDHVKIIRIGSKLPAFNPMRIYEDEELLQLIRENSYPRKKNLYYGAY